MQQERSRDGEVKVDRVRLQEQLAQFHLDKEKMRNRNLDYSPRFRSGDELRMTGKGDNRSVSPTFPLNARVSGKEKRRRVHAWLGAQIGTESQPGTQVIASPDSYPRGTKLPEFQTPELPDFATHPAADVSPKNESDLNYGSKDGSDLLRSKSEFFPGDMPYSYPKNFPRHPSHMGSLDANLSTPGVLSYKSPAIGPESRTYVNQNPGTAADFSGGGDNYCYVYDPIIAKAYTKKYPISPSVNTPPPPSANFPCNTNTPIPKYAPASQNFTPSPAVLSSQIPVDVTNPSLGMSKLYSAPPISALPLSSNFQPFALPTKYEEYDMRPIKPLDLKVKKSVYGEAGIENKEAQKVQQPRPYLRRSHTAGVSYPIPKSAPRSREKSASRVQNNVEGKRIVGHMKRSPRPSPKSPRRKRPPKVTPVLADTQPQPEAHSDAVSCDDVDETPRAEGDFDETPRPPYVKSKEEEEETKMAELPVDLKHVRAATKIQAVWKGYRTRKLDARVVEIRQEVRARRAEQYISVLCHEVQCLKENLDAEKKMRDLQTEAIRYIWSQLRTVQKKQNAKTDSRNETNIKHRSPERRPRSKSNSPRRGTKRGSKKCTPHCSPHGTPRGTATNSASGNRTRRTSDSMEFEDETESVDSAPEDFTQKRADVSWKEVPDEALFPDRREIDRKQTNASSQQQAAEDTDEGRGTLLTDGEGNPAHSSAEDDSPTKPSNSLPPHDVTSENLQLKTTIDTLQNQVAQLQEAMMTLSDKILNRSRSELNLDTWDEGEELKLVTESQEVSTVASRSPPNIAPELAQVEKQHMPLSPEPALSARGEVPRVSLKNALATLQSALSENELWAICEQAGHCIQSKPVKKYLALETTYVRKDGRIEFSDIPPEAEIDEMYLAPEALEDNSAVTQKSSVFSLSVVLWSAADWEMSAEQAPQLSQELESLLVVMSQDEVSHRAEVDEVIQICEDHHAKAGVNSLCVCSSLFAEVQDALTLAHSGKINQKKIAQEVSKEQELLTKKMFKEAVVPEINSCTWKSNLKPASNRVLSPRRQEEPTPHEKLMSSLSSSKQNLRKSPLPKLFTVRDMFLKDPELVQKLNILPGQRKKNQKAMRLVMRRQSPKDSTSAPLPGIPTPPRALRAGVSDTPTVNGLSSVILRWHLAKVFDKHGQESSEHKVIGYRIYVNGHPKGMVAGTKSRALLEGLRQSTEYRVHVRAVSSLGESDPSNTVIAHITSSPMPRSLGTDFTDQDLNDISSETSATNSKEQPVAPPKAQTVPKARPRLGAVFPSQNGSGDSSNQEQKSNSNNPGTEGSGDADSSTTAHGRTSSKSDSKKGDDIIDRVLRRYGIQQTAAIVPGYASGSTLSPMPVGYRPKSTSSSDSNRRSVQSSLLENMAKSTELSTDESNCLKKSDQVEGACEKATPNSHGSGDITAKSIELLEQLKSDLLS